MTVSNASRSSDAWLARYLVACACVLPAAASAWDSFQYQGFAAQGYAYSDANNVYGPSADGSFEFHEIGVNASVRPTPRIQVAGQLISRRAGETSDGDPAIDYLLGSFTAIADARTQLRLHVGKIKLPLGLYNDTRDIPFTRPSILLPQSIYLDRTREIGLSAKGGSVQWEQQVGDGQVSAQLLVGKSSATGLDYALFGQRLSGRFDSRVSYIGQLRYDDQAGTVLAVTAARSGYDYHPGSGDPLGAGDLDFTPVILSIQHDAGNWEVTSELALRPLELRGFGPAVDTRTTGQSGYLQGVYRFNAGWQAMLRYDVLYTDRSDRDGSAYAATTGRPAHTRFARDLTAGLRWVPNSHWLVSAEFHHVDGTAWLAAQDNPQPTDRRWNLFLAQVAFRF